MSTLCCSLTFFLFLLFSCLSTSTTETKDYWLQVSHQAPSVISNVTFLLNGKTIKPFQDVVYGTGSEWTNVTSFVAPNTTVVNITVSSGQGLHLLSQNVTLKQSFISFFLITQKNESAGALQYSWDYDIPSSESWFLMINLCPCQTGKVTFRVNDDALQQSLDWQKASDWYSANAGFYQFNVTNSSSNSIANSTYQLGPGQISVVIMNGFFENNASQLFILESWQSNYSFSEIRAVQSVPDAKAYVWVNGQEFWQTLSYTSITNYELLPAMSGTKIYVSLSEEMPSKPTLTFDFVPFLSYSLLITGYPNLGVPLEVEILEDQAHVPMYTVTSDRVVYLSPGNVSTTTVQVWLNQQNMGELAFQEATKYADQGEVPLNLTLVAKDFIFQQQLAKVSLGSTYSIFVMGINGSQDVGMEALLAADALGNEINKIDEENGSSDDDDDDSGLSGGAIAGIVIGLLAVIALISVGLFVWMRRRSSYQPIPQR